MFQSYKDWGCAHHRGKQYWFWAWYSRERRQLNFMYEKWNLFFARPKKVMYRDMDRISLREPCHLTLKEAFGQRALIWIQWDGKLPWHIFKAECAFDWSHYKFLFSVLMALSASCPRWKQKFGDLCFSSHLYGKILLWSNLIFTSSSSCMSVPQTF